MTNGPWNSAKPRNWMPTASKAPKAMFCHQGRQVSAMALPIKAAGPATSTTITARRRNQRIVSMSISVLRSAVAAFEIGGPHFRIGQQLAAGAAQGDQAVDHHVSAMSELQRVIRVLLHQEYGHA